MGIVWMYVMDKHLFHWVERIIQLWHDWENLRANTVGGWENIKLDDQCDGPPTQPSG